MSGKALPKAVLAFFLLAWIVGSSVSFPVEWHELANPRLVLRADGTCAFMCSDAVVSPLHALSFLTVRKQGGDVKISAYKSMGAYARASLFSDFSFCQEITLPIGKTTRFYYSSKGQPDEEIRPETHNSEQ